MANIQAIVPAIPSQVIDECAEKKDHYDEEEAPYLDNDHTANGRGRRVNRWLGSDQHTTVRGMKSRHLTFIAIGGILKPKSSGSTLIRLSIV